MQIDRIFEKAIRLGIISVDALKNDDTLRLIASEVGLNNIDNLNSLENRLDAKIASSYEDDNIPNNYSYSSNLDNDDVLNEENSDNSNSNEEYRENTGNKYKQRSEEENSENGFNNPLDRMNRAKEKLSEVNPVKEKKEEIKENIKENAQNVAKQAVKQEEKEVAKGAAEIALKNPKVRIALLIGAGILLIIILLVILAASTTNNGRRRKGCFTGYEYYEGGCEYANVQGNIMPLEEYVARVAANEIGSKYKESLKVQTILARTYTEARFAKVDYQNSCYYDITDTSQSTQTFKSGSINEAYYDAADETEGLIVLVDGKPRGNYDASCIYTATQAKELDPSGYYSSRYYYVKYAGYFDGVNFQKIEKDKALQIGTFGTYINYADNNQACHNNHGGGLSQNGANYLEEYEGYDWEDIIDFYYNGKAEIKSISENNVGGGLGCFSGDYPIDPNNELYQNLQLLHGRSFESVLKKNGSSVKEFEDNLKKEITRAGVGTRKGVVAAAMTLIGSMAETGYKINYKWGGKYATIGVNPSWGLPSSVNCDNYESRGYNRENCERNYKWGGFDCSGFVTWALINGLQRKITQVTTNIKESSHPSVKLEADKAVCDIGGAIVSGDHIKLIVGVDEENKRYITAETTGSDIATNSGGNILRYMPFAGEGRYYCKNLDELYNE